MNVPYIISKRTNSTIQLGNSPKWRGPTYEFTPLAKLGAREFTCHLTKQMEIFVKILKLIWHLEIMTLNLDRSYLLLQIVVGTSWLLILIVKSSSSISQSQFIACDNVNASPSFTLGQKNFLSKNAWTIIPGSSLR